MRGNRIIYAAIIALIGINSILFAFTYTYDTDTPLGTAAPAVIDDRLRETKDAIQERMNVDHDWTLDGTEVGTATCMHRQVQFMAPRAQPTMGADTGMLYMKDVDGGGGSFGELYWNGEQDYELQITELNTAGNAPALNLTGTYENEVVFSATTNDLYADVVACTDGGYLTLPHDSTDTSEGNIRYDAAADAETVSYYSDTAWLTLLNSTTSEACQIKIGTYSGEADEEVTVTVGFQPDAVLVMPLVGNRDCFIKTSGMAGTNSKSLAGRSSDYVTDSILSLSATGFTCGDGDANITGSIDDLNETGTNNYAYIAVRTMD